MPIRMTGMVSGLDTDSIVKELVSAYSTKKEKYEKEQTKLGWKQEIWKSLNKEVNSFYKSVGNLRFDSGYNTKKTTSSDSTKATVSASGNATVGTQKLHVLSTAQSGYLTGAEIKTAANEKVTTSTKLSDLGVTADEITFNVGPANNSASGTTKQIKVGKDSTISDVVNQLKDAGLNANFDAGNRRFYLSSSDSGYATDFNITADSSDTNSTTLLNALGLGKTAKKIDGSDAVIVLNGVKYTSTTNNFSINGLSISVNGVTDKVDDRSKITAAGTKHIRTILTMEQCLMKSTATNKTKKVRVIPGYHLTLGITVTMLSLIVLIPLASVMVSALKLRPAEFWSLITKPTVRHAFATSIGCSFIAALINSVFGVIIAWVLVRYEFPGKRILDGCIELPFALPTSVAGITLSKMYSENEILGTPLAKLGIKVSYTHLGLVIALVFVGIPFVIRAVQPVLEKLDGQYEEAAFMLGANRFQTFRRVLLPEMMPPVLTGFGLAFARGIGEYGSVIYISGNSAREHTQVISYVIMQKLGYIDYASATAIALVMLILSFVLLLAVNIVQMKQAARTNNV